MISKFFSVIAKSQTYLNMVFLLLAFPLGILYFTFLVTGVSLGLGLAITLIGIPLLILMSFLWYWVAIFERQLTSALLRVKIKPVRSRAFKQKTFWKKITTHVSEPITWRSFAYLLIKFPMGIISFVVLTTLLSISVSFILAPILYWVGITVWFTVNGVAYLPATSQLVYLLVAGIALLLVSLHIFNGLAKISKILAKSLLGKK